MFSQNHVTRLSRYKAIIRQLKSIGIERIFAENLADICGLNSAQVRKDFSIFGIKGNKKAGYTTSQLIEEIDILIGKEKTVPVIIVGYGHIGHALSRYREFEHDKIKIMAAFDLNDDVLNNESTPPVLHSDDLEKYIKDKEIKIAILAVPDHSAQITTDKLTEYGIKGILNFTTIQLKTKNNIYVNNIDINRALETVIFYTHQQTVKPAAEKNTKESSDAK